MSQASMTLANVARSLFRSNLNNALAALSSCQSGTSRPTDITAGGLWVNTTTATAWVLNWYDGADDIAIGTLNTTTNVFTPSIANNSVPPSKLALGAWTTVASAATVDLGAQTSRNIVISGTTGITSFGSTATPDNLPFNVRFSGSLTITHSANLICPGATNLSVVARDSITVVQITTGTWAIVAYSLATLPAVDGTNLTNVTKLLASGTVSSVAQLDLVLSSYIAAGYTEFDLRISNLVAATNNTVLVMVVSTNGGSTYQTSNYKGGGNTLVSNSSASFPVGGSGQSLSQIPVFDVVGNTTAKAASGVVKLFCKSQRFAFVSESGSENPGGSDFITTRTFGWGDQTNVNAIRLQFVNGNITSLTYSLIGVA